MKWYSRQSTSYVRSTFSDLFKKWPLYCLIVKFDCEFSMFSWSRLLCFLSSGSTKWAYILQLPLKREIEDVQVESRSDQKSFKFMKYIFCRGLVCCAFGAKSGKNYIAI